MSAPSKSRSIGASRYDGDRNTGRLPAEGLAQPQEPGRRKPTRRVAGDPSRFAVGAVPDPWGGRERVLVTINREADVLEQERSAGRISEAAYQTGRVAQAVFERGTKVGSSNWGGASRVDVASAHEMAIGHAVDSARLINATVARMERAIGKVGARFLRAIIAEGVTFAGAAEARGQSGKHAGNLAGGRFRMLLEDLAVEWQARGKTAPQIVASFADAPDEVGVEAADRAPNVPIVAGRSEVTAHLGRAALDAAAGPSRTARFQTVRRSIIRGC